jgi:glycerol kinase
MAQACVLAIDQGTTSTRVILFDSQLRPLAGAQKEIAQHYPAPGHVEHDPEEIWSSVVETCREAIAKADIGVECILSIGIANQRETTLVWERATGAAIHRAIVWQDRRTASVCDALGREGAEALVRRRTGLLLDPYFSATKIAWILDHAPDARAKAARGELAFGTVDSWLVWRLTGGRVHATDATNASRTSLFDIHKHRFDDELLDLFRVPGSMAPEVKDCAADFGATSPELFGRAIPIRGIAGDQHAATIGQACFAPGMMKATYGTGCFALLNTGAKAVRSKNRLLTTIAYRIEGKTTYALEGSIFIAGAAVQWLRDGLRIIASAAQSAEFAASADPAQNVVFVPAFVGLGAPYWDSECRGAIYNLTRGATQKEIARAALESVCFQTLDLLEAMRQHWPFPGETILRVDGGMSASDYTMQRLSDIIAAPVDRPSVLETTALGAAYLAGLTVDLYPAMAEFAGQWRLERRFMPEMKEPERQVKCLAWRDAIARTLVRKPRRSISRARPKA